MLLEVLHGHRGEIEQFIGNPIWACQSLARLYLTKNVINLIQDRARKETAVLSLDVFPESHLEQREAHVTCF